MNQPSREHWFHCRISRPHARVRLFCFPAAGGATVPFFHWPEHLPDVEIHVAQLPGRERRRDEAPILDAEELLNLLVDATAAFDRVPTAFYGHSMGAVLAFEVARRWQFRVQSPAVHLFVAGRRAPQVEFPRRQIHRLSDAEFLWELENRWGALPAAIRQNAELMGYFLPVIRADITLLETYRYRPTTALACPITAYGGRTDPSTTVDHLQAWREQTDSEFDLRMFDGDHFFPQSFRGELLEDMAERLASCSAKACQ